MKHLSLILLVFMSISAIALERVALVIGNSDYQVKPLVHPVNDARDMARVLGKLGFDVTLLVDVEQDVMESAIEAFGNKLGENTVGLFYFSGHGSQYDGENYLLPINSINKISAAKHLRYKAVPAGYVLGMMQDNGLNIVILDACRNNPFKGFSKSLGRGLAQMGSAEGTLIAYATAPGTVALTGETWEQNSVYTKHLLKFMQQPDLSIESMLKKVRRAVIQETRYSQTVQRPWYEASISDEFYFVEDFKKPSLSPIIAQKKPSDKITIPDIKGKWLQISSNAGNCSNCFITITHIDSKTVRIISNNGWKGIAKYNSKFYEFNGKVKWNDNIKGVYAGIEMNMQIYKNGILLKLKTNGDYNLDITYKKFSNISKIIDDTTPKIVKEISHGTVLPIDSNYTVQTNETLYNIGLVAYLPFNGNAKDMSNNENDGIISGVIPTSDRNGKFNHAYSFNGIDSFVKIPNSISLAKLNHNFSVTFWTRPIKNMRSPGLSFIRKGIGCYASGWAIDFEYEKDFNKPLPIIFKGWQKTEDEVIKVKYSWYVRSTELLKEDVWYFVTVTSNNDRAKIYVNGKLSNVAKINTNIDVTNNHPISIGANNADCNFMHNFIKGTIDEIRIYNRSLTHEEIKILYLE